MPDTIYLASPGLKNTLKTIGGYLGTVNGLMCSRPFGWKRMNEVLQMAMILRDGSDDGLQDTWATANQ